ncbi:MAG: hypothetical protein WB561_17665 [Terracidiphilus sp.]
MRASFCIAAVLVPALSALGLAQPAAVKPESPVRLELTMEVATTNDDGSPQALRFTLTNAGNVGVDLPMPAIDCDTSRGSIHVYSKIVAGMPGGFGSGHGCGGSEAKGSMGLIEEIKRSWYHLEPGEYLAFTGDGRRMIDKTGGLLTYEYWAEYEAPRVTDVARSQAAGAGRVIPAGKVSSPHLTFSERWPQDE